MFGYVVAAAFGVLVGFLGAFVSTGMGRRRPEASGEPQWGELLRAVDRVADGDLVSGFESLAAVARRGDAPPEVYLAIARILRRLGHVDRSAQVYRTVLARPGLEKENEATARVGLALDLADLGRPDEAQELTASLSRRQRAEAGLQDVEAQVAVEEHDWERALNATDNLRSAERGSGGHAEAVARIAADAAAQGDAEAALRGFRKAIRIDPKCLRARWGLAQLRFHTGKLGKARRQLVAILNVNPHLAPLLLPQLRKTLVDDRGEEDEKAFVALLEDLEEDLDLRLWTGLEHADRYYRAYQLERARVQLAQLLDEHPASLEAHEAHLNLIFEFEDARALRASLDRFIDLAAQRIRRFRCGACGHEDAAPFLECPACELFGQMEYEG